jgi:hypothetical protein
MYASSKWEKCKNLRTNLHVYHIGSGNAPQDSLSLVQYTKYSIDVVLLGSKSQHAVHTQLRDLWPINMRASTTSIMSTRELCAALTWLLWRASKEAYGPWHSGRASKTVSRHLCAIPCGARLRYRMPGQPRKCATRSAELHRDAQNASFSLRAGLTLGVSLAAGLVPYVLSTCPLLHNLRCNCPSASPHVLIECMGTSINYLKL